MKDKIRIVIKYIIAIVILIILVFAINNIRQQDLVEKTADRWDSKGKSAHISAYLSEDAEITENEIKAFEEEMKARLQENDALNKSDSGKVWNDCYSSKGTINITKGDINVEVKAIGVGGDFFLFHPLQLISGSYFSADNIMQDLIVIDEDTAWRMYGSADVQGQTVEINGVEHIISGVIRRDSGILNKAAGNGKPTVYVSYDTLRKYGGAEAITTYEIVMPNLTKNYAYKIVKNGLNLSKNKCEIKEVSGRYSNTSLIKVIANYGKRSMKTNNIIYPYWENVARAREDICAGLLFAEVFLLLIAVIYVAAKLVKIIVKNLETIKKWFINLKELFLSHLHKQQ